MVNLRCAGILKESSREMLQFGGSGVYRHVHNKTSSTHSDLDLLEVKKKGEDEDETFPKHFPDHCRLDPFHLHPLHLLVKPGRFHATYLVKPEPI